MANLVLHTLKPTEDLCDTIEAQAAEIAKLKEQTEKLQPIADALHTCEMATGTGAMGPLRDLLKGLAK